MNNNININTKIFRWLLDEAKAKSAVLDTATWKLLDGGKSTQKQINGFDCGVFVNMCADTIAIIFPIIKEMYCQKDMTGIVSIPVSLQLEQ